MSLAIIHNSIDDLVRSIRGKFLDMNGAEGKLKKIRILLGQQLNDLRGRVERGEVGEGVEWWPYFKDKFDRSRRDAEKCMALARSDDPEAAHDKEKADRKERRERQNERNGDAAARRRDQSERNSVGYILTLIEGLTDEEREELFAEIEEKWGISEPTVRRARKNLAAESPNGDFDKVVNKAGHTRTAHNKPKLTIIPKDEPGTNKDGWEFELQILAGDTKVLKESWKKHYGDWENFSVSDETVTLVEQVIQEWRGILKHLKSRSTRRHRAATATEGK